VLEEILNPRSLFFWLFILILLAVVFTLITRYFRPYVKFIYPNAKFEAIGNPFLLEKELNILVENQSLDAFKDRVNLLRDYQVSGETASSIQKSLDENLLQTMRMMHNDSPKKLHAFYELYLQRLDFYLVKNEIKTMLLGGKKGQRQENALLPATKELLQQLQNTSKEMIPPLLASYGFEKELIDALSQENPDLLQIDILFDKHFLHHLADVHVPHKCEQGKQDFMKNLIDMLTIKHMLRAKHLSYPQDVCKTMFLGEGKQISRWRFDQMAEATDLPQVITAVEGTSYFPALSTLVERYAKEKSVQLFEQVIHTVFLQRIKELSLQNYLTIGPTLRFLVSKEFEITNLKAIAKGIAEHLSAETIKNSLIREVSS
jgi:V/A-type H+/Na+-transporting ATPase subunit C